MRRSLIAATALTATALTLTACSSSGSNDQKTSAPPANGSSSMQSMDMSSGSTSGGSMTGTTTGSAQAQQITVHTTDMLRFQPSVINAHVGTVKVQLVNDGSYPHNMDVMSLHVKSSDVSGDLGSKNATFTLHFTKAGKYPFECTYHDTAGMKGMFVVKG